MATSMRDKIDWLYPELLSKEGLIEILTQRCVKLPNDLENTSRDELLALYYQFVIPRPQRKYRSNRRGRDMTRKQILLNKRRLITGPDTFEPPTKKSVPESSRLLTSFEGLAAGDRLKPPPSCVNFEKKVIKLGGSKTSSDTPSTSATSPTQKNAASVCVSTTPKVIKINRTSSSGDSKSPTSPQQNSIIKLNSHHSGSGDSVKKSHDDDKGEQPMETDSPEPSSEKKVKIKKISWP